MAEFIGTTGDDGSMAPVQGDFIYMFGQDGVDRLGSSAVGASIEGNRQGDYLFFFDGGSGTLDGGADNDNLRGGNTALPDHLYGGAGDDWLRGDDPATAGGEADFLEGGAGSDAIYGFAGDDVIFGGDGADSFITVTGIPDLPAASGLVTSDPKGLYGGVGSDTIYGGPGSDILDGGPGADILVGGSEGDAYIVDNASDKVVEVNEGGGDGSFDAVTALVSYALSADAHVEYLSSAGLGLSLTGSSIANVIVGDAGKNVLTGLAGNDGLEGNAGNDMLSGGLGNDKLAGGAGKDVFVFDTKLNKTTNVDHIVDFMPKVDHIHIDNAVFTKVGKNGALSADAFFAGTKAKDAEDRLIYDKAKGSLSYDPDGTGHAAMIRIALLDNKVKLAATDFLVI